MALIKCKECGGIVSDLATSCPHCGCPVEDQQRTVICPECGQEISEKDMKCPNCGCPAKLFETQKPILLLNKTIFVKTHPNMTQY